MTDEFSPRDSKNIAEWYTHPRNGEGQGRYVMFDNYGEMYSCSSGNELRRIHELDPSKWLTGPIWLPLSAEDYKRVKDRENWLIDNY